MIIGHEKNIQDLKHLAASGRLAHAYLFHGPSMIGKCLVAVGFANYLESDNFFAQAILQDALIVRPDEKRKIGIDEIRQLKAFLWQRPALSSRRTVIIDRAELLTKEAQNALLKIAEEPPASTLLILITSDPESLAPTLTSRLHKIYFSVVQKGLVASWLNKAFKLEKQKAVELARKTFGKPGLAAALLTDENLQANIKSAKDLLKLPQSRHRDFIKKLIEPDDFSLAEFLDALIIYLASNELRQRVDSRQWHSALELRHNVAYFNLNPRLQLESLLQ